MDQLEMNVDTLECDGTNVTMFFSNEGKKLQDCIVDVLNKHMEQPSQT